VTTVFNEVGLINTCSGEWN